MSVFEPGSSGIGSNRAVNCATTTAHNVSIVGWSKNFGHSRFEHTTLQLLGPHIDLKASLLQRAWLIDKTLLNVKNIPQNFGKQYRSFLAFSSSIFKWHSRRPVWSATDSSLFTFQQYFLKNTQNLGNRR